jgi:DNA-directed RNA polymerase subunit K/omega
VLRFMYVMEGTNDLTAGQPEAPALPSEPAPPIQSRFLFVDVAALRAKQLRRGARVRFDGASEPTIPWKPERVAMEEVRRGLVYYEVPAARGSRLEDHQ